MTVRILQGDCRDVLRTLPDESVQMCVTSPPYFGLRDYGVAGQMGLESSPEEFIAGMVEVFGEVRRVLREDGTLWLNIGDSYATNGGPGWQGKNGQRADRRFTGTRNTVAMREQARTAFDGYKPKDLMGIPWMLAFALRADGWYLRQEIIWHKPNPMPESISDRCTKAHESIFLLAKSAKYFFNAKAIAEPASPNTHSRGKVKMPDGWDTGAGGHGSFHRNGRQKGETRPVGVGPKSADEDSKVKGKVSFHAGTVDVLDERNKRSVWTIPTAPFKEAHFATFPPALVEPCILAGCPEGGTVLDPFFGAGTTGLVADRLRRDCIGIELNTEYAAIARKRIVGDSPLFAEVANA